MTRRDLVLQLEKLKYWLRTTKVERAKRYAQIYRHDEPWIGYMSFREAIESLPPATEDLRFTIKIEPGVYLQESVTLPNYLTIRGA